MSKVIPFLVKKEDKKIKPNDILKSSINKLESVLIIGMKPCGEFYFQISPDDFAEVLYLLKIAESSIMDSILEE